MALNINGTTGISGVDGSASAPALKGTDSNTGINFGSDIIDLNTGGSSRFKVGAAGQLGVAGANYGSSGQALLSQGSSAAPQWGDVGGGIVKAAARRYYGFDQTTGIGNAGFTRMDKAFVTITPSSASNYIKLGGVMNWSGSDTENQYSFRWRREISGGATTSLDASVGSGLRPGIQFRLLGNGDVATLQLQGVIDYPNTTSAITYYIEAFVDGAGQSVYLNRGQNDSNDPRYERAASYFIAEEINNSIFTYTNEN